MNKFSEREMRALIERLVPFDSLVNTPYGNVYCPFHEDPKTSKSKSARFYFDSDGIIRLHCWGEHRFYTAYDYLVIKLNVNPSKYLTDNFSEKELKDYRELIRELGYLKTSLNNENTINKINNTWVDSFEDIPIFLDSIYHGYHLEELN